MSYLESKYSNQVSAKLTEDQLAPAQVVNLSYNVKQGEVLLSWTAVTKNADGSDLTDLAGYRIYRKGNANDSLELVGSVPSDQLSYSDASAKDGASYLYAVSAIDSAEVPNESEKSTELAVKTIPSIPSGLTSSATKDAIILNWASVKSETDTKLNENLAGYNVYRSETDNTGFEKIGNVAAGQTSYEDTEAVLGKTYYYVITSFDDSI
ncbi:hypothetical protein O0R52_21535 (plasmid) [Bacillus halotolerans]|uniref:Fibronectin type-III domain-containing protein n=1 Tax=Bacillus halotolerans TaxID=260554 RepID=A0ABY7I824_9BACI|nr:hypothetical protein [Bacillus halotolerans]WAT23581.1 hypothetical protein O0R52_21535 [Bacillus halotolerans]